MVKALNLYLLDVNIGIKKKGIRAAMSFQNKVDVGNYSCPTLGEQGESSS